MTMANNNIFQIFIQDKDADPIPTGIQECIATVINNNPTKKHYLLGDDAIKQIIKTNLDSKVLAAYERLTPYTYKSDLGRHCLLYLFGGWYLDATVTTLQELPRDINSSLLVFKDAPNPGMPSWDLSTAVIYGTKGHDLFKRMIECIVHNVETNYYGTTPLSPTGPTLFGKCLAELGESTATQTGMLCPLTPHHLKKNYAFILPDGEIAAFGKKTWGTPNGDGLKAFTEKGINNYNDLYYQKKIYAG